jgi:excisionase family DNA binding protein
LESYLRRGLSLEAIGQLIGRHPTTVRYGVKKLGLSPVHRDRHAPRGGIERETLAALVERQLSTREIAERLGLSQSTVRHWLRKHGLRTFRARAGNSVNGHRFLPNYGHRFSPPAAIFSARCWPSVFPSRWGARPSSRSRARGGAAVAAARTVSRGVRPARLTLMEVCWSTREAPDARGWAGFVSAGGRRVWRVRDARSDSYRRVGFAGPGFVLRVRRLRIERGRGGAAHS